MIGRSAGYAADELRADDMLRGMDRDRFVERLAHHYDQFNYVHPFREGNGRTQRVFWDRVSRDAGYTLDWREVSGRVNDEASRTASEARDLGPLQSMFDRIAAPLRARPQRPVGACGPTRRSDATTARSATPSSGSTDEWPCRCQRGGTVLDARGAGAGGVGLLDLDGCYRRRRVRPVLAAAARRRATRDATATVALRTPHRLDPAPVDAAPACVRRPVVRPRRRRPVGLAPGARDAPREHARAGAARPAPERIDGAAHDQLPRSERVRLARELREAFRDHGWDGAAVRTCKTGIAAGTPTLW